MSLSGCGFDGDLEAHGFELADESALLGFGISTPVEPVGAELLIGDALAEDVPGDDEDGVADGDGSLLLASAAGDLPELGGQVGALQAGVLVPTRPSAAVDQVLG